MKHLTKTSPHGDHDIELVEDAKDPDNRIYRIAHVDHIGDGRPRAHADFTGAEIESVAHWWIQEQARPGRDDEAGTEANPGPYETGMKMLKAATLTLCSHTGFDHGDVIANLAAELGVEIEILGDKED